LVKEKAIDSGAARSLPTCCGGFLGKFGRDRMSPIQAGAHQLRGLQIAAAKNATHGYGINEVRVSAAFHVGANLGRHLEWLQEAIDLRRK
jgi:hypothetical protein